ncbi:hypothetical protein ACF09Y_33805 [Streptomyces massasporeus]|uniref:hypothetical protein n=1 Tax=Streptomyces massasporeus TaxID=67324 RepID=UPI0036FD8F6D
MNSSYQHLLTAPGAAKSPQEVLSQPVTVLLGVSVQAAKALGLIHIEVSSTSPPAPPSMRPV